jgi:hypothetical protein
LKPNGVLAVTVPSYQALRSEHDVTAGHSHRYALNQIKEVVTQADFLFPIPPISSARSVFPYFCLELFPIAYSAKKKNEILLAAARKKGEC